MVCGKIRVKVVTTGRGMMFLKYLFPWGRFQFTSVLTCGQIATRLTAITGPTYKIMGPDDISGIRWVFVGEADDRMFCLMTPEADFNFSNFSRSRNMWRPVLSGRLSDSAGETLLTVRLRMQIMAYVVYGGILVIGLWAMRFDPVPARPAFLFGAIIIYAHSFFWVMAARARRYLIQALTISS